jgi:DNA-binding IclR family transcriptional regulator
MKIEGQRAEILRYLGGYCVADRAPTLTEIATRIGASTTYTARLLTAMAEGRLIERVQDRPARWRLLGFRPGMAEVARSHEGRRHPYLDRPERRRSG